MMTSRLWRAALPAFLVLAACERAPDAPPADGSNPDATVGVELPAGATADGQLSGVNPGFLGATAPEDAYDLGDGAVCYIYPNHVVRVSPRTEGGITGEPRGDEVAVLARGAAGAREQCSEPGRIVTQEDEADTFAGIEGDVLFLDRASGEAGRMLIAMDLDANDEVLIEDAYEGDTIEIENGGLRFGTLERTTTAAADLVGVECEQGAEFVESGLEIGIVRLIEYDIDARERRETDRRVCIPLD